MASDHILALLISERNKLTKAIEALQGPTEQKVVTPVAAPTPVASKKTPEIAVSAKPAKRKLSAAGRRAIIEGTKKRWAAFNAAKTGPAAPAVTPKAAPAKAPAKAKNAAFRKKMSERMKAAWALRKKKTAPKTK